MALNPLSFSVGVKDEASKPLEDINKALNNLVSKLDSIKNIAISLGGDPAEAESLMKSLNGVAASLASISKMSPEAQAASDRLTASQKELNKATEEYNNLLAKIKSVNPAQVSEVFQKATKAAQSSMGVNFDRTAPSKLGELSGLDPTKWAENLTQYLHKSLGTEQIEVNVRRLIANIRHIMASELSGLHKGPSLAPILEESFNFNSVNEKLNNAFRILREEFIKGMKQLQEVEGSKEGLGLVEKTLPGLKAKVEAAQKEFDALKNATSSTPVNPEAFKGAEGAIAATNEATKMLGEAINKLDFSKINTALDQLAERLNKLVTELEGIEARMKTAFTGALEANVKSLGDVIDGLAKKMAGMSAPMSEGMKQGEQATRGQTEALKEEERVLEQMKEKASRIGTEQAESLRQARAEVEKLQAEYKKAVETYTAVFNKLDSLKAKTTISAYDGKMAFPREMESYVISQIKKLSNNTADSSGYYNLDKSATQELVNRVAKRYELLVSEAEKTLRGMLNSARGGLIGEGSFLTQFGQYFASVKPDTEAVKAYNREKLAASKEEKRANEEMEASYKRLEESKARLAAIENGQKNAAPINALQNAAIAQQEEKVAEARERLAQATQKQNQGDQQTAEHIQKLAQSSVTEAFTQLAASLTKIKELFDNLGKAEGLTQLNNTINGVNTAVEALAKTLSNVNNAVKFTGSTEEIASYEAKIKSLQEQVAALEAKAKGLGETAKAASEQVKNVTASGGSGGGSKDGLTEAQLKRVNDQMAILEKRLRTLEPAHDAAKDIGFKDEVIAGKIKYLQDYKKALDEAIKAGSIDTKVGDYRILTRAANEDIPTQKQAEKMAKQMQEYIAIQQQAQAEAERQAQAQERMRQAAEAAGMSIVKAGEQTQSAGQQSEGAKQQMHGFNEEILVNMRSWEQAGKQMAIFEKRIFAVMTQLQSGKALGFDTGNLRTDIQELMRFYAIMKEIRNNYGFANIEGAMLTTSKVLKESGLDFGQMWEKNKQELNAVKTIYEQMVRLQALANNKNALPTDNLNIKYQREALENALRAQDIMAKLKSVDLRQATALVGGQDYQQATAAIEAFFMTYNKNANIATSQTAELQRLLEKIQGTDKGGGWINVMKNAGVSEDKINEMRQIAEKIQRAIAALEQSRQMGTAANFVQSDWYRATVVEGKKANDTGYLAVREAHEQAAAEREAARAAQEAVRAAEKKREEINKSWREQEAARQKEAAAVEASMQKQMAAEEKARQRSIELAWKAAEEKKKAEQSTIQKNTEKEVNGYNEQIRKLYELERAMSKIYAARKEKMYSDSGLRKEDPGFKAIDNQLEAMMQKLAQLRKDIDTYRALIGSGSPESVDFGQKGLKQAEAEAEILMRQYVALKETRDRLSAGGNEQSLFATEKSNNELALLNETFRKGQSELQKMAKAEDEAAAAARRLAEEQERAAKAQEKLDKKRRDKAGTTSDNLQKYIDSLRALQNINFRGLDTTKLDEAINKIRHIQGELARLRDTGSSPYGNTAKDILHNMNLEGAKLEARNALKELNQQQREAAAASQQLTAEQQRLAQALNQTTEHARGQSQVLSDLKMMATQYLGVWGAQQFLHNIVEIGGQLEMQRMSIGAILQNQSQANELFEKIKGLARQSPFGVVELDQMTKQLTAYGFKYNELYDMTKRLADISAATGTGVDRLALALGHVRSEAALSGYTLRQFSMGNIPLLQKLSEKLGKTTAEIRKMVRTKDISYEDVEGIIKDLTNEGGMFYNMQEVISESVKARFKNVKDSMAIMYGEMAEGATGDALKGVADALMEITKNWKDAATVIGTSAAIWAAHRAAIMLHTAAIGKNNAAVISSIASYKAQQAQALKLAWVYRERSAAEMQSIATSKRITAMERLRALTTGHVSNAQLKRMVIARQEIITGNALALSQRKLTAEDIAKQVATAKLTKTEARRIIIRSNLTDVEKTAALNAVAGVRTYGRLTGVINGAALAAQRLGLALKSLVLNPAMLGMAAISGIVELWQRNNQELERAEDLYKSIFEASQEALKNTRTMMGNTGINAYQFRDGKLTNLTNSFGVEDESRAKTILVKPEFDPSTAQQVVDEWSQYIREYAGTPNKILNNALKDESDSVRMLKDQFDLLYESVDLVMRAQKELADLAWVFAASQDNTGEGVFDEDVVKNIQDYEKALKTFNRSIVRTFREHGLAVKRGIDAARKFDKGFADATEGMTSYIDMLQLLLDNEERYETAVSQFKSKGGRSVWYNLVDDNEGLSNVKKIMEDDVTNYIESMKATLRAAGKNPDNLDDVTKEGLMEIFTKQFIGSLGDISDKTRKELIDKFANAFHMSVDEAEEITEKRLADWQSRAQKVFEVNKEIKVKTKTITSLHEFAEEVQKDLKEKQEYITKEASHIKQTITIQTGIKFNMQKLDVSELEKVIVQLAERVKKLAREGHVDAAKALLSIIQDELMPFRDVMKSIDEDKKWLKQEGYPEKDPTKDKSKNKKDTGSKEDKNAKAVRERVRVLKEAADAFEYWNKKLGPKGAWERVNEQFGEILSKIGVTIDNIEDLRGHLKAVSNSKEYKAIKDQKVKLEIDKEIAKDLDQLNRKVFEKSIDEYKSKFTKMLDDITRKWEIFTSVRNVTGDKMLAFDMAEIGKSDQDLRNAADALKRNIAAEMQRVGGDELIAKIPFSIDIDEEKLRDQFKEALGDSEKYATAIDGLVEGYKKWQKLQQDVVKNDIDVFAKIIGLAKSYDSQIKKINNELQEQMSSISANPKLSKGQKVTGALMANADADWKKMKLSADYANLHNRAIAMSAGDYKRADEALRKMIKTLKLLGLMSPEDFSSEMSALEKAKDDIKNGGNSAFAKTFTGNIDEALSFYAQKRDEAKDRLSKATPGSKEELNAQRDYDAYSELYDQLAETIEGFKRFSTAMDNITKAMTLLANLFDAIGNSTGSEQLSAGGGIIGGAMNGMSSMSGFGPYGMAAGFLIGGATAMIQEGDKATERAINKLRGDVQLIESDLDTMLRQRERTLGYDTNNAYLKSLYNTQAGLVGQFSSNADAFGDKEQKRNFNASWGSSIMRDYYQKLIDDSSSGYQSQYNALIEERANYLAILDKQNEKKNKSNEEIAETQKKIAELDDQIAYFTQDLAKELWSIDIKGWADQLSDALASAFENGENMAKAYRDTVTSIIQQMMQKMMQLSILEPMFERLQKQLFGENGKGGVFDPNNPRGSMSKVTAMIADFFGKGGEGEKAITASMEFMTAFQRGMQNAGLTVLNEASNTLSSSMQGTTEETSGLLAGYVNALRQDVSVNRILLTQFVSQMWPDYMDVFASQVTAVQNIDNNVQVIMTMMQMGSGAMYNEIAALRSRIDNVVLGIDKFAVK